MRIVVTGGTGVLGRWILRELSHPRGGKAAHVITSFDRRRGRVPQGVRTVIGDHEDLAAVCDAVAGADAILHLSASHLSEGADPDEVFRSNVAGVFNIHEAARIQGVRRVVHYSSVAALGWSGANDDFIPDYLPIDEGHPLRATDAYGLSKAAGEDIARTFAEQHGLETIALRLPMTITPLEGFQLWRNGGKTHGRWIHYAYLDVRDSAAAARRALEAPFGGHATVFLAADDSCAPAPLADLLAFLRPAVAEMAAALTGTQSAISNTRAKALLDWAPRYTWRTRPPWARRVRFMAYQLALKAGGRMPSRLRGLVRGVLRAP